MIRTFQTLMSIGLAAAAAAHAADGPITTRTGWFADQKCASSRVADGRVGPPGRTCTQECIRKGVPVVFIDEKTKKLYRVSNPAVTRGQECDHVEITATIDQKAGALAVATIKVLEAYVATCAVQ